MFRRISEYNKNEYWFILIQLIAVNVKELKGGMEEIEEE